MTTETFTTTVGVFSTRANADAAIESLHDAGFSGSEIGVVNRNSEGGANVRERSRDTDDTAEDSAGGAAAGAAAGVGIGALIGAGVLAGIVPVIGPALFAGTLGVLASNAAGGAAVVGLVGALTGWGMSNEDATYYESEVTAGRTIVTVTTDRCDEAGEILRSHGGATRSNPAR